MAGGLVALLDDVAALARMAAASADDIAAGVAKAGAKAAGVVIDDAAVTPQYVDGVTPNRELPIIWRIAKGSIINKLIIIVILLILNATIPWILTPLLMLGGTYLCYEGAEKVWEKIRGHSAEKTAPAVTKGKEAEDTVVRGAVTTDFILSCEILVISLAEIADTALWMQAIILVVVAFLITALVYGAVALLVKMDDIGLSLQDKESEFAQKFGRGLVNVMPTVMAAISLIGTFAMLWVGGHIILTGMNDLGFTPIFDFVHSLEVIPAGVPVIGGFLSWLINTVCSLILGLIWGLIVYFIVHPIIGAVQKARGKEDFGKKDPEIPLEKSKAKKQNAEANSTE